MQRARRDTVRVKADEFTRDPDARLQQFPFGDLWVKVPAAVTGLLCVLNVPAPLIS